MSDYIFSFIQWLIISTFFASMLGGSAPHPDAEVDRLSNYTEEIEYDFLSWVANASWIKLQQAALGSPYYLDSESRKELVIEYLHQMDEVLYAEWELSQIYSNPEIADPELASKDLRERLDILYAEQHQLAPFAESVLEGQVSAILAEASLTTGGQPLPRPLYHVSPLPMALIISPRETIRQDKNISLLADFPVSEQVLLENEISADLNVSALVVPVGGVGIYPTMGMRSTNLPWIVDTMAHEWMHNYLTWHPLGANYMTSPALRTMNETVASIVGGEVGKRVLERFYPEYLAAERPRVDLLSLNKQDFPPNSMLLAFGGTEGGFDYRAEMHITRLRVDELLAAGEIDKAEAYMEARRQLMWENGYAIRKLNQAYFAFHGAYADIPGGAAGTDPVGPAVRKLREQSDSLAGFVHIMMWFDSFEDLEEVLD